VQDVRVTHFYIKGIGEGSGIASGTFGVLRKNCVQARQRNEQKKEPYFFHGKGFLKMNVGKSALRSMFYTRYYR
jgi:hypothetical protein